MTVSLFLFSTPLLLSSTFFPHPLVFASLICLSLFCQSFCPANLSSLIVGLFICKHSCFCFSSLSLCIHSLFCLQISPYPPPFSILIFIFPVLTQLIYLPALPCKYVYLSQLPFHLFPLSSPLCFRIFVVGIGFFSLCFLMTSLGGQFSAKRPGDSPFTVRAEGKPAASVLLGRL